MVERLLDLYRMTNRVHIAEDPAAMRRIVLRRLPGHGDDWDLAHDATATAHRFDLVLSDAGTSELVKPAVATTGAGLTDSHPT